MLYPAKSRKIQQSRSAMTERIDERRLEELSLLVQKGEVKWTEYKTKECPNCQKLAREYQLWNSAGRWDTEHFCDHCGFDSWVKKTDDFNFDLNVLGGV